MEDQHIGPARPVLLSIVRSNSALRLEPIHAKHRADIVGSDTLSRLRFQYKCEKCEVLLQRYQFIIKTKVFRI